MKLTESQKKKSLFYIFTLLSSCLLTLIIITCVEASLYLFKIGYNRTPFLKIQCEQTTFFVPNPNFYQQFFDIPLHNFVNWDHLDFNIPLQKAPNCFRIFVFGESAMYGLENSARQLEVMLKKTIPEIKWEIYNVSCPGINSHVLYFLAKACTRFSPDIFLIYMGNNETIGPYGEHSLIYNYPILRKTSLIRTHTWLKQLRIAQIFEKQPDIHWQENRPKDLKSYTPRQGQEHQTLHLYENNLRDMINMGIKSKAHVIVATLSFNRKFGIDPSQHKSISFQPTAMNQRILALAENYRGQTDRVRIIDLDKIIAEKSPDGIPGYEYFCDNIHFTFEGNYIVAQEWFRTVISILKETQKIPAERNVAVLSREECALNLGWNKATALLQIQMQKNVITDKVSLEILQKKEVELSKEVGSLMDQEITHGYQQAYQDNPDDEKISSQLINYLIKTKQIEKAFEVAQTLISKHPCSRIALRLLGDTYAFRGEIEDAINMYQKCLKYYPDDGLAKNSLYFLQKYNHATN